MLLGAAILGAVAAKKYTCLNKAMKVLNAAGQVCKAILICFYCQLVCAFIMKRCVNKMLKLHPKIVLYFGFKLYIKWFNLDKLTDSNA